VRARKRFGQHFLEPAWVRKVIEAIAPAPGDVFVEIGPGPGALTRALAETGAPITAVELDRDLAAHLSKDAPANVSVVEGDILRVDLDRLLHEALATRASGTAAVRVVGNLPYNIASSILLRLVRLFRGGAPLRDATLMLQEEVAVRLMAPPGGGDYGPLAIAVQLRADVRSLLSLPPGAFRPPPKVRSALVGLTFRPARVEIADEEQFERVVRTVFTKRRKTLANALQAFAAAHGTDGRAVAARAGLDGRRRPETLDIEEFARLSEAIPRPGSLPVL
jgi:16S rRNA (adenine1518-N6/adenine1519-N6)-dimethyltransferase